MPAPAAPVVADDLAAAASPLAPLTAAAASLAASGAAAADSAPTVAASAFRRAKNEASHLRSSPISPLARSTKLARYAPDDDDDETSGYGFFVPLD